MKKILTLVVAVSALIFSSCASGGGAEKSAAKPAEPEVLVGTEYTGTFLYRESPWGILSDMTVFMVEMGLEPLEVKGGEVYRVTGKLTMGEEDSKAGKTVHFGFQETRGWSGLNVLAIDEENGIAGRSFDFDYEWTVAANATGEHDAIQFCIAGPDHEEDDSIDFTIDQLKFEKIK